MATLGPSTRSVAPPPPGATPRTRRLGHVATTPDTRGLFPFPETWTRTFLARLWWLGPASRSRLATRPRAQSTLPWPRHTRARLRRRMSRHRTRLLQCQPSLTPRVIVISVSATQVTTRNPYNPRSLLAVRNAEDQVLHRLDIEHKE